MDILFPLFAMVTGIAMVVLGTLYSQSKVSDRLRAEGLEPVSVKLSWTKGTRYRQHIDFVASTTDGQRVTGHAEKAGSEITVYYDPGFDRLAYLREKLSGGHEVQPELTGDSATDLETRIRFETNQRLERLQGDRESFLANDLNGDGTVDAEEWELVRARIAAEVRAELTGTAPPKQEVVFESFDEPSEVEEPVEEPAEVLPDGHW